MTKILAIETSCDETSAAVVEEGPKILSNVIASQIKSHQRFGGVVPEIASRHHVEAISLVIEDALKEAGLTYGDLNAVAVTQGPGLVGSLLVGISAAKTIALAHNLPLITVNHIVGHIYAGQFKQDFVFPALALIVSGGHTELILMRSYTDLEIIGETRDDAVGEAYDKIGRVLGVPYPGGKHIDEMAQRGNDVYDFPRAMIDEDNYDFSFSGLKSAFINKVHNADQRGETLDREDLAASFQAASVDVLIAKTLRAAEEYGVKQVILGGGVAANSELRTSLETAVVSQLGLDVLVPDLKLCGDNAAMIGAAAHIKYAENDFSDLAFNAQPGMEI